MTQQIGAWIGAAAGVLALLGALVTVGIRVGSMQATLDDNTQEIRFLRDDVRILRSFIQTYAIGEDAAPGP